MSSFSCSLQSACEVVLHCHGGHSLSVKLSKAEVRRLAKREKMPLNEFGDQILDQWELENGVLHMHT